MSQSLLLNEARRPQKADIQAILDGIDYGLCLVDSKGIAAFCDEAFLKMAGFRSDEFIGQNFHKLIHPRRPDGAPHSAKECPLQQAIESGQSVHIEGEFLWRKDGTRIPLEGWALPFGHPLGFAAHIFTLRGATDRVEADRSDRNSEEGPRLISHTMDRALYFIDVDTSRFVYVGPAFEAITGLKREEANTKPSLWLDLVVQEDQGTVESDYRRLLMGAAIRAEYRVLHADGSVRWIVNHANPIFTSEGKVHLLVGIAEDVTEKHRTDVVRSRDEGRFRRILANMPDIAWTADQEGRTVYISPNIETVIGYTAQEIYANGSHLLQEWVHPDDFDRLRRAFKALFENQTKLDEEFRVCSKDGKWIWVHEKAIHAHEENGVLCADGTLCDITRRKQAELELQSKTALLEAQVNSTIDGILVVDECGQRILENQRLLDIFKIPPEILSNTTDQVTLDYVARSLKNPEAFLAKVNYLNSHPMEASRDEVEFKDGTILDRYSSPVVDQYGKHYGRISTFRDITDRKKNEDKLRQLSLAVEQSPVSVVITDPKGAISYVNRKFTECTGYTLEEVITKNPRILNSGYSSPEMYKTLWTTILQGKVWQGEFRNKKKNGEIYWEAASITPILNSNGSITHILAVKEDITERLAMEAQLRQAQKLEGIGQLAAGIAHEINTPIQFVTDNLVFLRDSWMAAFKLLEQYRESIRNCEGAISPEVIVALKEAERNCDLDFISSEVPRAIDQGLDGARRVAKIVRAMKEFSHPDSADKTLIDLNKAIESTITVARNEWKYVAEIDTEFDEALPPIVCYSGEVNQVILNLIVNAAHSIKEKVKAGEKGKITICTCARGEFAEIAISDTGTGIPEAIHTRIFEPFFTTKDVGKGTGQGLALAHSVIVKKHSGKIWFETEMDRGTTFFINLPIEPVRPQKEI